MKKIILCGLGLLIISLFLIGCVKEAKEVTFTDEEGNVVGKAFWYRWRAETIPVERLEVVKPKCLKDYEIGAYAVQGFTNRGEFKINGEQFTLDVGGNNQKLKSGATVGIDKTLIQAYAGGLRGVDWDLMGACSSDYAFETYYDESYNSDAKFMVVSTSTKLSPVSQQETFNLKIGEAKTLRDGTKIILRDTLTQLYAGGLNGVLFELICS